jgi:mannose-1-phosphate guanylyltransferase/mannose-1-phosphate guanylyltransferase/phosphomannomutase
VFPALLENDVPFYIHETDDYWNDVGSLDELRSGTFDALAGRLRIETTPSAEPDGVEVVEGPAWIGSDVSFGEGVRLIGPVVIGDGSSVGAGASLRDAIVFPGTEVPDGAILIGAISGHTGIVDSLRPLKELLAA